MRCCNCPINYTCTSPARNGGGCDMDGADDYGCDLPSSRLIYGEDDYDDWDDDDGEMG